MHDSLCTVCPSLQEQASIGGLANPMYQVSFPVFFFLSNSSTFTKWQTGLKMCLGHTEFLDLVTDEQADVCCRAIWSLIVPFHTRFPLTVGHLLQENESI